MIFGMRLKVLTYNIHKGFCFYSRQYVLDELREAIRSVNADIVFLQEVMGVHPVEIPSGELTSQFEYLAHDLWPHYTYGRNAVYSDGHHGNAILSKHPVVFTENINISTNPLERRGLLHAQVAVPHAGLPLHLVCLHLDLLERGRRQQMKNLIERVSGVIPADAPLIVAGDFNDWSQKFSDPMAARLGLKECGIEMTGAHAATFPSWRPFLALDRVYTRNWKTHAYQVLTGAPWRRMSDHAAVVVELGQ